MNFLRQFYPDFRIFYRNRISLCIHVHKIFMEEKKIIQSEKFFEMFYNISLFENQQFYTMIYAHCL